MQTEQIQSWDEWSSDNQEGFDSIIIASRQISNIAGVNLKMKGRHKANPSDPSSTTIKFSVSPKLFRWKGITGWEHMNVIIRNSQGASEFCILINGNPMSTGPGRYWNPIKSARHIMERAVKKIHKN
jgi:hypothetical protein